MIYHRNIPTGDDYILVLLNFLYSMLVRISKERTYSTHDGSDGFCDDVFPDEVVCVALECCQESQFLRVGRGARWGVLGW